ncbi:MAG TPA: hypothetical protein DDX98_14235 [Bacteroidales bacterium]|jgi:hypothetical protein|nr:hypothetical protein [Bacteroidales bacterium]
MKKHTLIFVTILISIVAQAQNETGLKQTGDESQEIQTLMKKPDRIGWWVSGDFTWTKIDEKNAFLGGLSGGMIINHSISIGLAGYGIMNSQNLQYEKIKDTVDVYIYGGYGGLKLEYRLNPLKKINIAFPLLIGGGGIALSTYNRDGWNNTHYNQDYNNTYAWDSFFVIEPGVALGVNLQKFMRIDIGTSYRYAPGIDLPNASDDFLNGFNANVSLKFGSF